MLQCEAQTKTLLSILKAAMVSTRTFGVLLKKWAWTLQLETEVSVHYYCLPKMKQRQRSGHDT